MLCSFKIIWCNQFFPTRSDSSQNWTDASPILNPAARDCSSQSSTRTRVYSQLFHVPHLDARALPCFASLEWVQCYRCCTFFFGFIFLFNHCIVPMGFLPREIQLRQSLAAHPRVHAVFFFFFFWDIDYGIFNVRTDITACDCTRGCTDSMRESALKVDSGIKN